METGDTEARTRGLGSFDNFAERNPDLSQAQQLGIYAGQLAAFRASLGGVQVAERDKFPATRIVDTPTDSTTPRELRARFTGLA